MQYIIVGWHGGTPERTPFRSIEVAASVAGSLFEVGYYRRVFVYEVIPCETGSKVECLFEIPHKETN